MSELYYTAPSDEQFNELKERAMELWVTGYPEETSPHYAKEKVARIKDITNVSDNFMYIVAMFDIHNQRKLANLLGDDTRQSVRERMIDGGQPEEYVVF